LLKTATATLTGNLWIEQSTKAKTRMTLKTKDLLENVVEGSKNKNKSKNPTPF